MPLVYSNPAYAALTVETAQQVGAGRKMERAAERKQQADLATMEINARRELAQFEATMRIQADKLSQAWELEKMQRQSELNFQFEQKKLTVAREAMLQKDSMAKEKYLAYVDYIDSNKDLSADEKSAYKQRAYDQIIMGLGSADRIYFPEAYNQQGMSDFGSATAGALGINQPGGARGFTGNYESDVQYAAQLARLQNPNAPTEQLQSSAKSIYRDNLMEQFRENLLDRAPAFSDYGKITEQAYKMADTELQVRQGYEESKNLGYKPTPYQAFESMIQGATKSIKGKIREGMKQTAQPQAETRSVFGMAPAEAQQQADVARSESKDNAVESIIKDWWNPSEETWKKWERSTKEYPRTTSWLKKLRVLRHKRKTATAKDEELATIRRERILKSMKNATYTPQPRMSIGRAR